METAQKQAIEVQTPDYKETTVIVFELTDKQASKYLISDNPDDPGSGTPIDTCDMKLLSKSFMEVYDPIVKQWKVRRSRYIKGCETPWVDEQDQLGYKPNSMADVIWMKSGKLVVANIPVQRDLFRFLTEAYNENSDVFIAEKSIRRPDSVPVKIRQIDTDKESINEKEMLDIQAEAQQYIRSLRTKTAQGFEYNYNAIEFVCSLIKGAPKFDSYNSTTAYVYLYNFATENSKVLLSAVKAKHADIHSIVLTALEKKIILLTDDNAVIATSGTSIAKFRETESREKKVQHIVDHLSNPDNAKDYFTIKTTLKTSNQNDLKPLE